MNYGELMVKLGESFGIEEFAPDYNGYFNLDIDDTVVTFGERPERGLLDIVAQVCDLPAEHSGQVLKILMAAMAPGETAEDYTFFVMDENDTLYLRRTERLADLDVEGVRQSLEAFLNALGEWRTSIEDFQSVLPAVHEELLRSEEEKRSFGPGEQGFIQI